MIRLITQFQSMTSGTSEDDPILKKYLHKRNITPCPLSKLFNTSHKRIDRPLDRKMQWFGLQQQAKRACQNPYSQLPEAGADPSVLFLSLVWLF